MFKRLLGVAACVVAVASGKEHIQTRIRSGEIASRAVNLGGWLLSEYWMCYTSPLYDGGISPELGVTGEYNVMKEYARLKAAGKVTQDGNAYFEKHWSTWITEKDIAEIAKTGLNTVRVSTGFWIINDEDDTDQSELTKSYPKGGLKYLDKLINEWAVKYNLAVMVSLHAHRGSQNGMDHSAPVDMWKVNWSNDDANIKSSFTYATFLANRYKTSPAFLGLNLMNEPTTGVEYSKLWQYYKDAYKAIRDDGNDCIIVTSPLLSDQGPPNMMDFMRCPDYYNVWHEFHVYYKWGWADVPFENVLAEAATYSSTHFTPWTGNPIFFGEWSLATWEENETDKQLTEFATVHMGEADKAPAGFAFWAWRHADETKKTSAWSMRQLLSKGIMKIPTSDPSRVGTRDPNCPVVPPMNYTSSGSDSASGSDASGSVDAPGTVLPAEQETNANTPAPVATPAPSASAVHQISAAVVVGVASALAWTL